MEDASFLLVKSPNFQCQEVKGQPIGTSVLITEERTSMAVLLSASATSLGRDYFFPYKGSTAGKVSVPHPSDGTIAITIGMTGCALEIRKTENDYVFYHDADGNALSRLHEVGKTIYRIESADYWTDEMEEIAKENPCAVQFMCVYASGKWHIGCFGFELSRENNDRGHKTILQCLTPKSGRKYLGGYA